MQAPALRHRLDDATKRYRLLEHPFYKAWAEGTLSLDDLGYYSTQYWRQVEAFPGYLASISERLPESSAKKTIDENLRDEVEGDHLGLWLEFAQGVGAAKNDVRRAASRPETETCVDSFRTAATERSVPFALGMLYAYESQTPGVAQTKIEGLRAHYGIDGPALDYFQLHGELDVEHSAELARALDEMVADERDAQDAVAGARAGAEAIWNLLSGIASERGIGVSEN